MIKVTYTMFDKTITMIFDLGCEYQHESFDELIDTLVKLGTAYALD